MEPEGRDTRRGRERGEDHSNVVRLPRDWIGPREDLVPFGPSAAASPVAADPETDNVSNLIELAPEPSLTQDDFWGGALDSIPRPLLGPSPRPASRRRRTHGTLAGGRARVRVASERAQARRRRLVSSALARAGATCNHLARTIRAAPGAVRVPAAATAVRLTSRTGAVAASTALALVGAGAIAETLAEHHGSPRPIAAAAAPAWLLWAPAQIPSIGRDIPNRFEADARSTPRPHRVRREATAHPSRARGGRRQAAPQTTFARATAASAAATYSYAGSSATSSAASVHPVTYTPRVSSTSSTERTATPARTAKSGPVGAGAPFAPGHLG